MTFRPKLLGKVHGLLLLMREQQRFEEHTSALASALSSVLLHASSETQRRAIDLFETLGQQLLELSRHHQGSREARDALDSGSLEIGRTALAWRTAATADLTLQKE